MIKTVIKCLNSMVMVFDERGEQIPEYQGQYEEVKGSILKDVTQDAVFSYFFDTEPKLRDVPKEEW